MASTRRKPGDLIGGYKVTGTLGQGGSGAVYRVVDGGGAEAALKLVDASADPVAAKRLEREVAALQSLRHPAVPRVIDAELEGDETFVVFELVPGVSLFQYIQEHGALTGQELGDFAEATASALEAVHAAGVVHRDVTPSNIMMGPAGPVLIDFGLSHREEDTRLTRDGLVSGTAGYVAPEVINGAEPGPTADNWAWAATVAYAMTGEAPFGSGTGAIGKTLEADPILPDAVGAHALAAALGRDLDGRPGLRDVVASLRGATERITAASVSDTEHFEHVDSLGGGDTAVMATTALDTDEVDEDEPYADEQVDDDGEVRDDDGWEEWELGSDQPEREWDDLGIPWRPRRPATIAVWAVAVAAAASLAPVLSAVAMVGFLLLSRTAYRRVAALEAVRTRRGARRSDGVVQTIGLPWHLLRALGEVLPGVLLGLAAGTGGGALGWWLISSDRLALAGDDAQVWGHAIALAVGALIAWAVMWWGPWMKGTREGAHRMVGALAPSNGVAGFYVFVAVVGVLVAAGAVYVLVEPWWWPLPDMPYQD